MSFWYKAAKYLKKAYLCFMDFGSIIGQDFLKQYFDKIIRAGRVPHTQLFVGEQGTGALPMALAFASHLLCQNEDNCRHKVDKLIHPDLHFVYPTVPTDSIKKPDSEAFLSIWREFLQANAYAGLYDWMKFLDVANKQGLIRVTDAENIIKKVAVKPYEANYKIFIIWMIEKMNNETANKLLKILEEPPEDTKFILIAENTDDILPTILSRCQIHHFAPLPIEVVKNQLIKNYNLTHDQALKVAHQANGNWHKAMLLAQETNENNEFQQQFIEWVRVAFSAKKDRQAIRKLIIWSEKMATTGREAQKQFLEFALETFRQALMINYQNSNLAYFDFTQNKFDLNKLAPFIHSQNIQNIYESVTNALYHIERNANPKLIFLDLSINLTKFIHKTEKSI